MSTELDAAELLSLRLHSQLLAGKPATDPVDAVARVCGVQAQAAPPARLAVRARTRGRTAADVDRASAETRGVVRTWAMRGTLHMLPTSDAAWLVGLLGPVFLAKGKRRRDQLGLDDKTCERALDVLAKQLSVDEPLPRAAIVSLLADHGVRIDAKSQAPAHLLLYAANSGLICRGPDLAGDEPSYVPMADWLGKHAANRHPDRDDALAALARRYLAGYGPATSADFATWSGLSRADAGAAFEALADESTQLSCDAAPGSLLAPAGTRSHPSDDLPPRLLGHFDTLLLGYAHRDLLLDKANVKQVQAGGGFIQPTVLVNGRVVGVWKLELGDRRLTVQPFDTLPRGSRDGLQAEARDIGRFLGQELTFKVEHA
jgi:hypothetical protein